MTSVFVKENHFSQSLRIFSLFALRTILFLGLLVTLMSGESQVQAQESQGSWQTPVNLSNSGSASKPTLIRGASGDLHILWEDTYSKFVYRRLGDTWSNSSVLDLPFYGYNFQLVASQSGSIGAFWINSADNTLNVSSVPEDGMAQAESWSTPVVIGNGVVAFAITLDESNNVQLIFARARETADAPAGIYYRNSPGSLTNWNASQAIYLSKYYRSMIPPVGSGSAINTSSQTQMHVSINSTSQNGNIVTYVGWENPAIKKLFFSKSVDGGVSWQEPVEVTDASQDLALVTPSDLRMIFHKDTILQIWSLDEPGGNCGIYARTQTIGNDGWSAPESLESVFGSCPDQLRWFSLPSDQILFILTKQNEISLVAWDGIRWSLPQTEDEINQFVNPLTSDLLSLGQIDIQTDGNQLFLAAKDEAASEDIWFTQKMLSGLDQWYRGSSSWSPLRLRGSDLGKITAATAINANSGDFYFLISSIDTISGKSSLNVISDDTTATVISALEGQPSGLVSQDVITQNRASVMWSGGMLGQIYTVWVDLSQASNISGWSQPNALQTNFTGFSPAIILSKNGDLYSLFSNPYDPGKGIYWVRSKDNGENWSSPTIIPIYKNLTNCPRIDQISLASFGENSYQAIFICRTYAQANNSLGLFAIQSTDGGENWSPPVLISDRPVTWSQILTDQNQILHRLWKVSTDKTSLFHSFSSDNGQNWTTPTNFALLEGNLSTTKAIIDKNGNIHLFQAYNSGEGPASISYYRWAGKQWTSEQSLNLTNSEKGKISAISAGVDGNGQLHLGFALNTQKSNLDESSFFTSSYDLGTVEQANQPTEVAIIATATDKPVAINSTPQPTQIATPIFDPGTINTSPSSNQPNYLGVVIGVFISIIFIIAATIFIRRKNV